MLRCVSPALNSLSIHVTFTAIVPGYPGRPKCAKNVLKWRTFELTGRITAFTDTGLGLLNDFLFSFFH